MMNEVKWKPFVIGDLFNVRSSKSGIDRTRLLDTSGDIPYLTRTNLQNGIGDFIGIKQDSKYKIDSGNVISIGLDTQTVHYQKNEFYTGQNIQVLEHERLNENIAKFLIPLIKIMMRKFTWGSTGATLTRLRRSKIVLPVQSDNLPDWNYMDQYIKEQEEISEKRTYVFLQKELTKIGKFESVNLSDVRWNQFVLGDLFKFETGKSKGLNHLAEGNIQYLGATNRNNGVLQAKGESVFVSAPKEMIQSGNCIAFIRNGEGSMGYSVYKSGPFVATSDITVGYNKYLNEYSGLFISRVTDQARGKYSFNYKRSDGRLKKELVMLPAGSDNEPDYGFMENYIKGLKYERIRKILSYFNIK